MRRPRLDWSVLPIHPLLAAAYPVVFLFAANAAEQVTLEPLWRPLLLAVGATAVVLATLWLLLRDPWRSALLTTVGVIGFFGYGHAWNATSSVIDSQWPLIGAWVLVILIGLVAAWKAGRFTRPLTRGLNLVAALALLLNAWALAGIMVTFGAVDATIGEELTDVELTPPDPGNLPDVYYIILDRYAGSTGLQETYDFDNEPFLTALEERGFEVARKAHSNYIKTPLSLASSLNMEMLDSDALKAEANDGKDREPIHHVLRDQLAVPSALKEIGYQFLQVASWWAPTSTYADTDRVFRYAGQNEFSTVLEQTTLLRAFNEPDTASREPFDTKVIYENVRYTLDTLDEIPGIPGPKFVFAHLLIPHDPYVFDTDGSFMDTRQVAGQGIVDSYRRQLQYANARMLQLVDHINASAGQDAVIMLQADEGPFPARYQADAWRFDWRDATAEELEEKFGILFAMRVPGADVEAEGFHGAITPVNAFRVIFNARFGTDLPLLPDRIWAHEDLYHFYDFFEITDRLRR